MREIKYRQPLWDEHNKFKGWHYWGFIDGGFVEPAFSPESSLEEAREQSQQCAGLKDKNLCQGDICTAEYRCHVCFDNEPHLLTGTIEQADNGLWMFDYGHGAIPLDSEDLEILEIIGDIHENPELLEDRK